MQFGLLDRGIIQGTYLRHRGKTFRVRASGCRTIKLLRQVAYAPECRSVGGLLRLRPELRRVISSAPPATLAYLIDGCYDPRVLRLAIWICGRSRCQYAIKSIAARVNHPNAAVRRESVRSLRRLSAWRDLRLIALHSTDDSIRRLATPQLTNRRRFSERLARFKAMSEATVPTGRTCDLVMRPGVDIGCGRPPRTSAQIRRVIRRIRRLVRRRRRQSRLACLRVA